jgi:archaellum biogenesis ATPase FlaH
MRYIEIALGAFTNRGKIIPETELESYINKAQELELPLFRSYFSYDEKVLNHIGKTLRAYPGTVYIDSLIFDIDKAGDKDTFLHLRAKDFVQNLMDNWELNENNIGAWYSGSGFHIEIPNIFQFPPTTDTETIKKTLAHYFPQGDNIYDKTRLIRVGDTINSKTSRYKILLSLEQFFDLPIEDIIAISKEPQGITKKQFSKFPTFPELIIKTEKLSLREDTDKNSTTKIVTCMQKLYNRGATKGTRHTDMLRLASSWRRAGIPYNGIIAMLEKWAPSLEKTEITHIVDGVFKQKYQYSCKDPVFEKYCDPKCIFYSKKNYSPEIHDSQSLENSYTKFIKKDFSDSSFDLADIYALENKFTILPGELVMVIGDTKLGKSAWVQNICTKITLPVLYLSLEMHERLTFRRFIQIAHRLSKEEVNQYYKTKENTLSNKISHIRIMSVAPQLDTIKRLITDSEAKVVVIDVVDAIDVKGMPDEAKITPIINELKAVAQQLDVIIIGVHHISKASARDTMLDIHSGKGSSSVEQKADKIIAIEGDRMKPYRKISSLGARDEHPFKIITQMSPKTFEFRQVGE